MSQIIRATVSPVGLGHGKTQNVERSGSRYMSDSSMRTNPSIDEPSNMIRPSSASSNCRSGISTFLIAPRMSVNWRRMNLTFSRSARSRICALVTVLRGTRFFDMLGGGFGDRKRPAPALRAGGARLDVLIRCGRCRSSKNGGELRGDDRRERLQVAGG